MRTFCDKYHKNLKSKAIDLSSARKPLALGHLDEKIKTFLLALRKKRGVVNTVLAIGTAKSLIEKSVHEHLKLIELDRCFCAKSLFVVKVFQKELQLHRDRG